MREDDMKFVFLILFVTLVSCAAKKQAVIKDPFPGIRGCFLLYNLKTNSYEKEIGDTCKNRYSASSSFKVPLAVMALDSGILPDEKVVWKWDGQKRMLPQWNKDHNGESWMKDSVVWFSQRITPKMGQKKVQDYLVKFNYGNKDISSGLTTAWLNSPNDPKGSLAISSYEQVEFMKKLWKGELPVSARAMELTKKITYLESSPKGYKLSGKTGSNYFDPAKKIQLGWFISHITNGEKEYIAVTNICDIKPIETEKFGGQRAKAITLEMLKDSGLW